MQSREKMIHQLQNFPFASVNVNDIQCSYVVHVVICLPLYTGLSRSTPNADQNPGIDPKYLSIPITAGSRHKQKNIGIGINAAILIGIDQH